MDIIKLNAIDSTNSYLLNLSRAVHLEDPTIVITNNQTKGRGQHGTSWQSVPQQSLLFSMFKRFEDLPSNKIPNITYAVSLGLENAFKKYKIPNGSEKKALEALVKTLEKCTDEMSPEDIQTLIYSTGKENGYTENLRDWFKLIYEVVFGDENGPRMGFFISFFGVKETKELLINKLK